MSTKSLTLDQIRMSGSNEGLELSLNSSILLQSSEESFSNVTRAKLLDLLYSGKIWVSRGRGYQLDFTVLHNGEKMQGSGGKNTIEGIAQYLRDASFWSQVSMTAKLEFPYYNSHIGSIPNFSICLQHSTSGSTSCQFSGSLLSPPQSLQAPKTVECLQLTKIEIVMNFVECSRSDMRQLTGSNVCGVEPMTFDGAGNIIENVYDMNNLPLSLQKAANKGQTVPSSLQSSSITSIQRFWDLSYESGDIPDDNTTHLKPNNNKLSLMSWTRMPTTTSLPLPQLYLEAEKNDARLEDVKDGPTLDIRRVKRMADSAMRHLIGGRQTKHQPGIKIMKPHPAHTLSRIAPGLWSPGFLQAMSLRSQFATSVSHTIAHSVHRNAQSPSLRRKLNDLGESRIQPFHNATSDESAADISGDFSTDVVQNTQDLDQIIQASLWRMMHLSLYDPLHARRLLPASDTAIDDVKPDSQWMIETDTNDASQNTTGVSQPPQAHVFSELAVELNFDDLFYEPPDDEDEDFKPLLGGSQVVDGRDVFEDLFCTRMLCQESILGENVPSRGFEDDEMDLDMTFPDENDSGKFTQENSTAEMLKDARHGETMGIQLDNESMLI